MRQQVPGLSQALRSDLLSSGRSAILRYFGPPQAAAERRILAMAVADGIGPRVIDLGSGVIRVAFDAVHVTVGEAVIDASVRAWSRSLTLQPDGRWQAQELVRVLRYTAALRHAAGGQWLIVSLTLRPAG
jgi:hypothetical protein